MCLKNKSGTNSGSGVGNKRDSRESGSHNQSLEHMARAQTQRRLQVSSTASFTPDLNLPPIYHLNNLNVGSTTNQNLLNPHALHHSSSSGHHPQHQHPHSSQHQSYKTHLGDPNSQFKMIPKTKSRSKHTSSHALTSYSQGTVSSVKKASPARPMPTHHFSVGLKRQSGSNLGIHSSTLQKSTGTTGSGLGFSRNNQRKKVSSTACLPASLQHHLGGCSKEKRSKAVEKYGTKVAKSLCLSIVFEYLTQFECIRFQTLSRYFYSTQVPRCSLKTQVTLRNTRLHLLNQDYLVLFDFLSLTKTKRRIRNQDFKTLWNQQSIEIRGRIYMTGGAIANTKAYLKKTCVLNEETMEFEELANMNYQRDAHGITSWKNRYIIVVGSWHGAESAKTCEKYDVQTNKWEMLPSLNDGTCAPGLLVMHDRYLYKLGGTSDIGKVEMLDLEGGKNWISINTSNKFGRKHTINRCLLYPLPPTQISFASDYDVPSISSSQQVLASSGAAGTSGSKAPTNSRKRSNATALSKEKERETKQGPYELDDGKFLVLGCHFGRSEKPFIYDIMKNKYQSFEEKEVFIDMYRSNDVVQFDKRSIYIRPFVKVGEKAENVKVFQFFLQDTNTFESYERQPVVYSQQSQGKSGRSRSEDKWNNNSNNQEGGNNSGSNPQGGNPAGRADTDGPNRSSINATSRGGAKNIRSSQVAANASNGGGLLSRVASLFSKRTTTPVKEIKKGTFQEVNFKSAHWEIDEDEGEEGDTNATGQDGNQG